MVKKSVKNETPEETKEIEIQAQPKIIMQIAATIARDLMV